jgi:hypothetical protein
LQEDGFCRKIDLSKKDKSIVNIEDKWNLRKISLYFLNKKSEMRNKYVAVVGNIQ